MNLLKNLSLSLLFFFIAYICFFEVPNKWREIKATSAISSFVKSIKEEKEESVYSPVSLENFNKISPGMERGHIETIIGASSETEYKSQSGNILYETVRYPRDRRSSIVVRYENNLASSMYQLGLDR